jgi:excisionase family DNA binding protein
MASTGTQPSRDAVGTNGEALPEAQIGAERFLTIQDVCNCLNVSRTTVWRLMHEHGLRVIHIGGIRRIRQHDLEVWLERHCTSGNGGSRKTRQ